MQHIFRIEKKELMLRLNHLKYRCRVITVPILFSGIAAVLLQLRYLADWPPTTDIATVLAGISAITAGFAAKIDAKRKLNASSTAKSETESFRHTLKIEKALDDDRLREINKSIDEIYAKWVKDFGYSSG
jgi:hypothetical protein